MDKNTHVKKTREDLIFDIVAYTVISLLMVACFYPLWYVFSASLTNPVLLATSKGMLLWPKDITFEAYRRVFVDPEIWTGLLNSIFYTVVGTALNVMLTAMIAYALAHKQMMFTKAVTKFVTFTMFFNGGMIPTYLLVRNMGLLDHRFAVLLPGMVSVFNLIIMRTQFESIPASMEESAKMDGANDWYVFIKIILPLSLPTIAVMILFSAVGHWNSWFNEMLYLPNSRAMWPLALITREIILSSTNAAMSDGAALTQEMADAIKYAAIIISALPVLVAYPFVQKHMTTGMMVGAVKG